ncbi:hypothetical protein F66182_7967 [Fusarium sp. NRRL 66182]|nr:hypothetical protein F66182_7967 [Fusarium sp. NRRL 66182]
MTPHVTQTQETSQALCLLDDDHRHALDQAVRNVLNTEVAERAYAQILDGLPTKQSLTDSYPYVKDHPSYTANHVDICPGYVEKAQLVVVACHQIGAYLFELDDGAHKNEEYQNWRSKVLGEKRNGVESRRFYTPSPIAFCHRAYRSYQQYPRGFADVAGYWAESKIFGGVVVFDRGESEQECKSMWIHGDLSRGPKTLYPPTQEQFDALVSFLTCPPRENSTYPFPIHGSRMNRPRWHSYHAFAYHHIFRDRYERKLAANPPRPGCVESAVDWPEFEDQRILMLATILDPEGRPYNSEEEVAAASERIRNITPSSPLWSSFGSSNTYQ